MRIEELILEGFKSYPVRTTITGWDASFNAITGLNGSGKSNILDAICFVLGITNMTSVRAANMLDLIYKRGQAGVTKASVTIVFNNSDPQTSPPDYVNQKQITVTRQIAVGSLTKYLLNGHKSTLETVQKLFQSVQLNINNPNFLIMQGKITKVLNMKPQEILGMVEEASGTRMFEERKEKAMVQMGKKDKTLVELQSLMDEEIVPKLDVLRSEKRSFLAYQKATSELERLVRLVKAAEWMEATKKDKKAGLDLAEKKTSLSEKKELITLLGDQQGRMEKEFDEIIKKRDKEMAKGGKLASLMETVKALGLDLEKLKTQLEIRGKGIAEDEDKCKSVRDSITDIESSRGSRSANADKASASFNTVKTTFDTTTARLSSDEELLQTLLTGLSSSADDNAAGGYMGQLAEAKARLANAGTEAEQAKVRIEHSERELKDKEPRAKKAEKEGEGLGKELEDARKLHEKLTKTLAGLEWDEGAENELLKRQKEKSDKMIALQDDRDRRKTGLASTDFSYADPTSNFDRTKVKGLVANLIELDEANFDRSTALEICAGGKLYNVVVEDEKVAAALLANKNSLKKRVTLLPLNKIQPYSIPAEKVKAAQKLAPGKVQTAISLVGYPEEISAAMAFVFGGTLICADKESAQKVTFDKNVLVKSITIDGDVYDPSGTLTGGAAPKNGGVLVAVQAIRAIEVELDGLRKEYDAAEKKLNGAKAVRDKYTATKKDLELQSYQVSLLEERVNGSNAARIIADVAAIKATIAELKETISGTKDKQKQAKDEVKRLEKEMNDFKNNKDSKLAELKASIATQKKAIVKATASMKAAQKEMQTAQLELEQVDQDLESAAAEVKEAESSLNRSRAEREGLQRESDEVTTRFDAASAKLKTEQAALASFDRELQDLERDIKHKKQEVQDAHLAVTKLEHEVQAQQQEQTKCKNRVADLEKQFSWIKDEKPLFGQPGSLYDFANFDLNTSRERCRELEEQQKGMKKKINPKVINMIDNVEKKETALKKMMATVTKDKKKIETTIAELDQYKRDALKTTWTKVNGDFGSIFAELLPGNFAKLQPPEGMDITEGLEVKIRLGSVWKASLTELSGGQRSLIALSLIMSLLQFKPAPMYILDEIDAALDLSHTQHIGQLFRSRFKGSQFIVVSLKEGLFTNANVLFKAKFIDGTSTVERTATRSTNPSSSSHLQAQRSSGPSARKADTSARKSTATEADEEEGEAGFSQEYSQFSDPGKRTPVQGTGRRAVVGR